MLYDAHAHLQDEWLQPHRATVFPELPRLGIAEVVVNGTCETDWAEVAALARDYPWMRPSFGLHPWDCGNRSPDWLATLQRHLDAWPQAGIGEIGLDRWILDTAAPDDPRLTGLRRAPLEEQREIFLAQFDLAAAGNRAASVHCLHAWGPLHDALRDRPTPRRGFLLHAYGGPAEMVPSFVKRGAYFSFNGYFLDERQTKKHEAFRVVPLERLLIETDAPAMLLPASLQQHTLPPTADGQPVNHPGNLRATLAGLARIRGIGEDHLEEVLAENHQTLFGAQ